MSYCNSSNPENLIASTAGDCVYDYPESVAGELTQHKCELFGLSDKTNKIFWFNNFNALIQINIKQIQITSH
jgi:hypothetical protein